MFIFVSCNINPFPVRNQEKLSFQLEYQNFQFKSREEMRR